METRARMAETVAENLREFFNGKKPSYLVNVEVLKK
jgi:lactate dehydrogenase-like 2-hydroxyacid dehydrogenase